MMRLFTEPIAVLRLTTYDEWWIQVKKRTRNMVRKSRKLGVTVKQVTPDEAFWIGVSGIYNEAPQKRGKPNTHYGMTPEQTKTYFDIYGGPDRNIYLGAYWQGELIGFLQLIHEKGDAWRYSAFQGYERHFDKAYMNALIDASVKILCSKGVRTVIYGRMQTDSLGIFKQHNGFERKLIPRNIVETAKRKILAVAG